MLFKFIAWKKKKVMFKEKNKHVRALENILKGTLSFSLFLTKMYFSEQKKKTVISSISVSSFQNSSAHGLSHGTVNGNSTFFKAIIYQ